MNTDEALQELILWKETQKYHSVNSPTVKVNHSRIINASVEIWAPIMKCKNVEFTYESITD